MILIWLRGYAGWSGHSQSAYARGHAFTLGGPNIDKPVFMLNVRTSKLFTVLVLQPGQVYFLRVIAEWLTNSAEPEYILFCEVWSGSTLIAHVYLPRYLSCLCLTSRKRNIGKQCGPRSDAAECGVWSVSTLFALNTGISIKHGNNRK